MVAEGNANGHGNGSLVPAARAPAVRTAGHSGGALQQDQSVVSPATVLHAVRRWWKWTLPVGLILATVVAAFVWYTFEPVYRARAWLHIQEEAPYLAFRQHEGRSRQFVNTQRELLRSPLVLEQVIADPNVGDLKLLAAEEEPVEWLRRRLEIRSVGNSEVFEVALVLPDAEAAKVIVNAVVDSYLKSQRARESEKTLEILRRLAEQREARESVVRTMRERVRELARQIAGTVAGTDTGSGDGTPVFDPSLPQIRSRLTEAEVERELLEAELAAARQNQVSGVIAPPVVNQSEVEKHPEVERLKRATAELAAKLNRVEATARRGRESRLHRELAAALAESQAALAQARRQAQQELRGAAASSVRQARRRYVASLERQIKSVQLTEDLFREKYRAQVERMEETGDDSLKLEFARAELEREEDVLRRISDRAMALNTELDAPWRVRPLFAAKTPQVPVERQPYKRMGMFAAAGLLLPFALVVLWEGYVRRVGDVTQLRKSQLPVVGEVAALPVRSSRSRGHWHGAPACASLFEESIHSVRTGLRLNTSLASMRVLTIASAVKREGKSSFAAQLAVSFARTSEGKVLLIDADMRSPDLHAIFEGENDMGLADVLAGEATTEQTIVPVMEQRLDLLPAGILHQSPHELVARGAFARLIDSLRDQYDTIIIDTPPVLSAGETMAIAAASDATVMCAMQNKSCRNHLLDAVERLRMAGGNPIGTILNGVPVSRYAYGYGYYS